jgi:hypothetical protein
MQPPIQLEYTCTDADLREAESLHLREQSTGKSASWTWAKRLGLIAGFLAIVYFRFRGQVAPKQLVLMMLFSTALLLLFQFGLGSSRKKSDATSTQLVVSECELTFTDRNGRATFLWSALGQCLESPNLFVLLDRPKGLLFVIPKRAFPDRAAQDWFRAQAQQPRTVAGTCSKTPFAVSPPADSIVLNYQLTFRDYLVRNVSSWRVKGIALLMVGISGGACLWQAVYPSADAVNGPAKVFAIMLPAVFAILALVILMVSLFWWYAERQYRGPKRVVLSDLGVDFTDQAGRRLSPWSTYQNYLENRWGFFVWNRRGMAWLMFPKHNFETPADLERFRGLIRAHLQHSRWFIY